jgi:RimJ/RimL family protein N-acetyltransferase
MHLDCGQCTVRNWTRDDRISLLEYANDRDVWRNLGERFPHPYTRADADRWFSHLEGMTDPTHWAIDVGGQAVGGIGVERGELEHVKCGRFGYWLGQAYWGCGIMTSAVGATSDYVLQQFDIVRLDAPVFAWNPASMRVLEKCGFSREGVLRRAVFKDGQVIDAIMYAKLK